MREEVKLGEAACYQVVTWVCCVYADLYGTWPVLQKMVLWNEAAQVSFGLLSESAMFPDITERWGPVRGGLSDVGCAVVLDSWNTDRRLANHGWLVANSGFRRWNEWGLVDDGGFGGRPLVPVLV